MLPFVAMFMIIVAVLFRNRTQFDFSCHESIITYYLLVENFQIIIFDKTKKTCIILSVKVIQKNKQQGKQNADKEKEGTTESHQFDVYFVFNDSWRK